MHTHRLSWIQRGATLLLALALTACSRSASNVMTPLPSAPPPTPTNALSTLTASPAAAATTEAPPLPTADLQLISGPDVTFQHVQFQLPADLASGVQAQIAPSLMNYGALYPPYAEFSLVDYNSQSTLRPLIEIYPAKEFGEYAAPAIQQLKELLADKPMAPLGELPILPARNAGQLIDVQVKYLTFKNGSGIRFLTQFGQDAWPIHNAGLVYVFQGMTSDDSYYISAFLPVTTPILPDRVDDAATAPPIDGVSFPQYNSPDFDAEYARYRQTVTDKLNATSEFTPALSLLDDLIGSMQVGTVATTSTPVSATQTSTPLACAGAPPTRLSVGLFAYVNPEPPLPNNLRSKPGENNELIGLIEPGKAMKILEGPQCADGWLWWKVRTLETDLTGWTAEGDGQNYWLISCSSQEECGS